MPSRFGVLMIILFWLGVTGHVVQRDILPRFFSDEPPPLFIGVADEAAQAIPIRWVIYRGNEQFGTLTTRMDYFSADNTFRFSNNYSKLSFDIASGLAADITRLESTTRVTRAGNLREQTLILDSELHMKGLLNVIKIYPHVNIHAKVDDGLLKGDCEVSFNGPNSTYSGLTRELEPVPVPAGQVLNPMNPVSRLTNVRGGRSWKIRLTDPLADSMKLILKQTVGSDSKLLSSLTAGRLPEVLYARVDDDPVMVERHITMPGEPTPKYEPIACWQINYRDEDKVIAKTWVSITDGKVICQEVSLMDEKVRYERDE